MIDRGLNVPSTATICATRWGKNLRVWGVLQEIPMEAKQTYGFGRCMRMPRRVRELIEMFRILAVAAQAIAAHRKSPIG